MKKIGDLVEVGVGAGLIIERKVPHNASSSQHTDRLAKHYHCLYYVLFGDKKCGPYYEDELKSISKTDDDS